MSFWSRIAYAFRGDRLNHEIDEEFAAHIEEAIAAGNDPAEVRRTFGSQLRLREQSRDTRIVSWLDCLRADLVFGWRQLLKRKVTTTAAVLSLALAIGACTSAFRLIDALFLRPLPVAHADRLNVLAVRIPDSNGVPRTFDDFAYPNFARMRAAAQGQAELIAASLTSRTDLTYATDNEMEKSYVQYVSGWMFASFGLRPALGRLFIAGDDRTPGASPYAVISYNYWTRRFANDPRRSRPHRSHRQRNISDHRGRPEVLHRHRARHHHRYFSPHHDEPQRHARRQQLAPHSSSSSTPASLSSRSAQSSTPSTSTL